MRLLEALALAAWAAGWAAADEWQAVDDQIQNFSFLGHVSFSAGDAAGRKHTFAKGRIRMWTPLAMASSSKFPVALSIAGAVVDGHLSFETRVHEVFPWWTSLQADKRSRVTLRQLLSFTSGIVVQDVGAGGMPCLTGSNASRYSPEECAREIYEFAPFAAEPGTTWSYHSLHLQVAGAMAAKAAGMTMKKLLDKYLIKRLGLQSSFWIGHPNPHLAAAMISSGNDYDKILHAVLAYQILPKSVLDEMERDYTAPPVRASNLSKDEYLLNGFGHYSMCLYFECVGQPWSAACKRNGIHADPGAFGFWPLVNRAKGYYMQVVTMRIVRVPEWVKEAYHIDASTALALPAMCTAPLRFGLQPSVERALGRNATEAAGATARRLQRPAAVGGPPEPLDVCQYLETSSSEAPGAAYQELLV